MTGLATLTLDPAVDVSFVAAASTLGAGDSVLAAMIHALAADTSMAEASRSTWPPVPPR